jgi:hypothetical protein
VNAGGKVLRIVAMVSSTLLARPMAFPEWRKTDI